MNPLGVCTKGILSDHSTFSIFSKNSLVQSNKFYTKLFLSLCLSFCLNMVPSSIQAEDHIDHVADPIVADLQRLNSRRGVEPPTVSVGDIAKIFNCDTVNTIPDTECEALVELHEQTDGLNWEKSWDSIVEPCQWSGVTCQEGHISILDLDGFGLVGGVPATIGDLTRLTTLKLNYNNLTSVPAEIGRLSNLFWLGLQDNQLSQIPIEIGALTKLTTLHLGGNQLKNIPPEIGNLTNLERLNLTQNFLENLPDEIGQLVNLSGVNISYNQLTALPDGFKNLQLLFALEIDGNQWTDFPIVLTELENLNWLYISNGELTSLPSEIANMKSLKHIDASNNLLSSMPPEIADLPNLESLDLAFNRITEPIELNPQFGIDWKADQIIPPDFRLISQIDSQIFDGDAAVSTTYSVNIILSPLLLTKEPDGYYEVRYATSLDDLDSQNDRYESATTPSRLNNNHIINDIQQGRTYFFQLYTHLPEIVDQDDIAVRKARISKPSEIISITVPSLQPVSQRRVDGTETDGTRSIYIDIIGEDFLADISATLFINDVILTQSPFVDSNGKFNLSLDFSDIPSFLARYNTEIVFNHPDSSNRTYLSIEFDFLSDSMDDISVGFAEAVPQNNSIKVPSYVSSFMFIPYVSR